MASIINKLKDYLFADESSEEYMQEEIQDEVDVPRFDEEYRNDPHNQRKSKVVSMNSVSNNITTTQGGSMKMILFQPLAYEDSQAIVDNLRSRKPVIVNMVDLERECSQRIIDFISGAAYALGGTIRKVSFGIFVIVPSNVSIVGCDE